MTRLLMNNYIIELFKSGRKWYFHAIAGNNKIVAASEGYYSKWNAKRAAKKVFPMAEIEEVNKDDEHISEDRKKTNRTSK